MLRQIRHDPQPQIGQWADGQRHALARKARDQPVILERTIAVIDATDAEQVERLPHVLRRPLLARMRDRKQAGIAGAAKHVLELARRVAHFR